LGEISEKGAKKSEIFFSAIKHPIFDAYKISGKSDERKLVLQNFANAF
jgi:hypothetical protein